MEVVIVGGGMAGLMAACALAQANHRVVVFDRDDLDSSTLARRCAPQGNHLHLLLTTGFRALTSLLPGIDAELEQAGAQRLDVGRELRYIRRGSIKQPFEGDLKTVAISRPALEAVVRRRVAALENVEIRARSLVTGLATQGSQVRGVYLDHGERRDADLVVDAAGRGSCILKWQAALGLPLPSSTKIDLGLTYASRFVRLPKKRNRGWKMLYVGPAADTWTRGGAIMRVEGDRSIVTLAGYGSDQAPLDDAGYAAYAATLGEEFHAAFRSADALSKPYRFNVPFMRRYHFEALRQHPIGLLALGDVLCVLDPAFGQGMSVAAEEARLLGTLCSRGIALEKLPFPYYRAAKAIIDRAWIPTVIEDFRRACVKGPRPFGLAALQWYTDHAMALADRHPQVHRALEETLHMTAGPFGLLRPAVLHRVIARAMYPPRVLLGQRSPPAHVQTNKRGFSQGRLTTSDWQNDRSSSDP
jgi:2-polyprenyl-6-methoxyphenol hydroxylase-like FAD-dependent oxidoreductase